MQLFTSIALLSPFLLPLQAQEETIQSRQSRKIQIAQRHKANGGSEPTVIVHSPTNESASIVGDADGNLSRLNSDESAATTVISGCNIKAIDFLDDGGQLATAQAECEGGDSEATLLTLDGGIAWKMLGVTNTAQSCRVSLSPQPYANLYPAGGGNGSVTLSAQGACPVLAISGTGPFITSIRRSSNTITFSLTRNDGSSNRVGFIVVGAAWVKLVQAGTGVQQSWPAWVAVPYGLSVSRMAQPINASILAGNGVEWQATSNSAWLEVRTFLGTGMGNGTLAMYASANTSGRARTARITVTGSSSGSLSFNVTQQ